MTLHAALTSTNLLVTPSSGNYARALVVGVITLLVLIAVVRKR